MIQLKNAHSPPITASPMENSVNAIDPCHHARKWIDNSGCHCKSRTVVCIMYTMCANNLSVIVTTPFH